MKAKTTLVPKLWKLALLSALFLVPAVRQAQATSTNPCPHACGYKWDPVSRCCITDPRFDCFDICF
ncbi:MAG: hypothetical protein JF614_05505 [Acidobacteria bacterium]|nr:hypothetical protein [Acidobacteriota bacterium]